MKVIRFLLATLCLYSGSLLAQTNPTYTVGSDLYAVRPAGVYRIYANTTTANGAGIELYGMNHPDRSGSMSFSVYPTNPSLYYGYTFSKYTGTTWKSQFSISRDGYIGIGDFGQYDFTAPLQLDKGYNRIGFGTMGVNTFGDRSGTGVVDKTTPTYAGGIGYMGFNAVRQSDNAIGMSSNNEKNGGSMVFGTIEGGMNFVTFKSGLYSSGTTTQWATPAQLVSNIKLSIDPNGNLGVGTTAPSAKLHVAGSTFINGKVCIGDAFYSHADYALTVNGKMLVSEVGVKYRSQWPDFVFDPSYKLKSLSEIESFVKANKHLPGVPSACEVAENGVVLGEMNAILLTKVEELTLHLIEQQKQTEALLTALKAQEMRIKELENNK